MNLEGAWKTQKWWRRIYSTIVGICVVDAFRAYYEYEMNQNPLKRGHTVDFIKFVDKLAMQLINNKFLSERVQTRQVPQFEVSSEPVSV